jgi:2-polyprenyl-3-methyl-5-hydroxy-6-metoxy-1,4-benzoquinol methylase
MPKDYTEVTACRVCDGTDLRTYLDLGDMPLVNEFLGSPAEFASERKFPLAVNYCGDCHFSQLTGTVDPAVLFRKYVYRSSVSDSFGDHCRELSDQLNSALDIGEGLVVDIASNDGYLLRPFKAAGNRVLGVDPARNLAEIANKSGIETIPEFWNEELGKKIAEEYGPAKAITAFNVFAHVPDLQSFVKGVKHLLDPMGYFVIESPHIQPLVDKGEFDTVYHEHVSYLAAGPVAQLMANNGLRLARVERTPLHGGSIRMYVEHAESPDTSDGTAQEVIAGEQEAGLQSFEGYESLRRTAEGIKKDLTSKLVELKRAGKKVAGFGASAKGNTLLNFAGIGRELVSAIFDDTPEKQGKFYPGVHIPVIARDQMDEVKPDYLLLLPWNFKAELMAKTAEFRAKGGKYILPIPKLEVIE